MVATSSGDTTMMSSVFIDPWKAIDFVDQDILLQALNLYGN